MFTSVSASKYKAWRSTGDIELAPVTGFFGANSSGKTSLLQLFLLLKQTVQSPDTSKALDLGDGDPNALVDVGGWHDLAFGRSGYEALRLRFRWTPALNKWLDIPEVDDFLVEIPSLEFSSELWIAAGSAFVQGLSYESEHFDVTVRRHRSYGDDPHGVTVRATRRDDQDFLRKLENGHTRLPPPIHCYGFRNEFVGRFENAGFLRELQRELEFQFEQRLFYLGPVRDKGRRRYAWHGSAPADVGFSGEFAIDALLASRDRGRNNVTMEGKDGRPEELVAVDEHVARMLRAVGLVSEFSVERASDNSDLYRVKVQLSRDSVPVDLVDVGFGVSQLLPLIVLLAYVPEGSTLVLEQPEMHLHPKVQSALADIFIDVTRARKLQIIFESHSEHMLTRLQRRIAEQHITPEHVALYFCENDGKESGISQLRLDDCGSISNWPKDFFGDAMGETAAIVSAGLRRRAETEA